MRRSAAYIMAYLLAAGLVSAAAAQQMIAYSTQSAELGYQEALVIYETNQVRTQQGLAPLRANLQLTESTRWFALDKVLNPGTPNCTSATAHTDSSGRTPGIRAEAFNYPGSAGAENVWCGWVDPVYAVEGWMESQSHAGNILTPEHREIGVGYSAANGGWLAQDFGRDDSYPPLIINNEALNSTARAVSLYQYDNPTAHQFQALRPIQDIQVSEDECMLTAGWQKYTSPNLSYTLSSGEGWKTVYARTRDAYGYTVTTSDSIYLGSDVPQAQINLAQMATSTASVTLYQLDSGGRGYAQFSLGWLSDQFMDRSNVALSPVSDSAALDGRAVTLPGGGGFAWDWTSTFYENVPLVAYFRLKVANKDAAGTLATLKVTSGTGVQERSLSGADFSASDQYVEFAVPFTFTPNDANPFLIFEIRSPGSSSVTVDMVSIFTAPQALTGSTAVWAPPGGSYRGQGVWVRYSNASGANFTPIGTAVTAQPGLEMDVSALQFLGDVRGAVYPQQMVLPVTTRCGSTFHWSAASSAGWLLVSVQGGRLVVQVQPQGLAIGTYSAVVTLNTDPDVGALQVPVSLHVGETVFSLFTPLVLR